MARIRSRDTAPERTLRRELHRLGLRFRLHGQGLPGKPDLVFARFNTFVFVHGCFWHRHAGCKVASTPKSNSGFWAEKFARNVLRDGIVARELARCGWRVVVVWECELQGRARIPQTARRVADSIRGP